MLVKIEARILIFQAHIFIFQARPCLQVRFLGSGGSTCQFLSIRVLRTNITGAVLLL